MEKTSQVSTLHSLVLWISAGRGVVYANDAFCEYAGHPIEQIIGRSAADLARITSGEIADFFENPLSAAIPNRLLADADGRIFELKTSTRQGVSDIIFDEVSSAGGLEQMLSPVSGIPYGQLSEEELRTVRVPDLRFITVCSAHLKSPSTLADKVPPLEHRIITGTFLEETTNALKNNSCTILPVRGSMCTGFAGAPRYHADHSLRALKAAFEQVWRIERIRTHCIDEGREIPPIGCGIASGDALVGGFGSGSTSAYLAEGTCVDCAERLSRIAIPGEVLITRTALDHLFSTLPHEWHALEFTPEGEVDLAPYAAHAGSVIPLENAPRVFTIGPADDDDGSRAVYRFDEIWRLEERDSPPIPVFRAICFSDTGTVPNSEGTLHDAGYVARLGKYRLSEVIGSGGMGRVWKARDSYGNTVAIKTLHSSVAQSPDATRRFRREAEVMSRVPHRNICRIFETGEHDGTHFIVMEYVEGITLSDILQSEAASSASRSGKSSDLTSLIAAVRQQRSSMATKPASDPDSPYSEPIQLIRPKDGTILPVDQAVGLMEKVCEAVEFAHQHGIFHRDLKPGNILLRADGEPSVADFGLAKLSGGGTEGDAPSLSLSGQVVGTVENMAPEQAESSKDVDARADVYSLGTILYQMCTGRRHFAATGNFVADLQALQTHEPLRPRAINPSLDRDLEVIILKCLRTDPAERYRSVSALLADLQRFRRGEHITARPVSIADRSRKFVRRHKLATATALLIVAATLVVGWQFQKLDDHRRTTELRESQDRQQKIDNLRKNAEYFVQNNTIPLFPATLASAMRIGPDRRAIAQRIIYHLLKEKYALPFAGEAGEASIIEENHPRTKVSVSRLKDGRISLEIPDEPDFKHSPLTDITRQLPFSLIPNDSELEYFYDKKNKVLGQYFKRKEATKNGQKLQSIIFYNLITGEPIGLPMFLDSVSEVLIDRWQFSPDGKEFVFTRKNALSRFDSDYLVSIPVFENRDFDFRSYEFLRRFKSESQLPAETNFGKIGNFHFSKDGQHILVIRDGYARILSSKSLKPVVNFIPFLLRGYDYFNFSGDQKFVVNLNPRKDGLENSKPVFFDFQNRAAHQDHIRVASFDEKTGISKEVSKTKFFAFHPDGKNLFISGADGKIVIWNLETSSASNVFMLHSPISCIAISQDGKTLAVGDLEGKVTMLDSANGTPISAPLHLGTPVGCLAFSPTGTHLAAGSLSNTNGNALFKVWNLNSKKESFASEQIPSASQIGEIEFSHDGRYILALPIGDSASPFVVNVADGTSLPLPDAQSILCARFEPKGDGIALVKKFSADINSWGIYSIKNNRISGEPKFVSKCDKNNMLMFSPDGNLACGFGNGRLNMWETKNGNLLWGDARDGIHSVSFDPSGNNILVNNGAQDSLVLDSIKGWRVSGDLFHNYNNCVSGFSPDSRWLAIGTRNNLRISNWINLDEEIPDWLPDFAEVYSGLKRSAGGSSLGIDTLERATKLEEILKKIQNNKDALSTAVRWIASPSHKRTISPYSTINSSTINSTVNSLHDFSDSNQKLVFQGIFNSERRSWGTEKDSTEFDGIISDNEGGFFIRNLGFPLRVLLQDRKVSIKGRRADSMPIPRLFKQDQHYNSVNFETKYKSSLVVDNWNEVEELPLTGVVNRVWAAKGRSKKVFLELKVSEAVKKEIEFASNSGISMSDLEKIQGTAISVFPNDMYYPLIHNPMDVFVDGVPWGYSIGSEVAPSTPFWQDFIQTNGAVQSVVGLASKYFDYSRHRGRYDTPGFQLLELTLDSGAKLGLILMVPSKEDPPAIAFSALVGKKIVARGRGLKLRGRPQLFIESLQDIRVENDKGELVPWLDAILQEFTIRFQSYEMVTRMGTIARFEAENQDGTRLFELVLENGGKVNISLHESILQTSSDDLLAKFVGKKVTAIGMKLSGKQMSRTNSEFMIMNINDLRLIDSESKNPTGAVSEKF